MNHQVVWILGASGGIGSETARQLATAGWTVVASGRRAAELEKLAAEHENIQALECDVLAPGALKEAHSRILADFGRLDALVHAVGSVVLRSLAATTEEQFRETLEVNLVSAFALLRAAAPAMARQGSGRIVLFSSVAAGMGLPNHTAIAAAKAGVEGLVRSAAADYARKGVRINAIAPALTETPLTAGLVRTDAGRAASSAMHPVGRIGTAAEVASVATWLVDGAPEWMTGDILHVDGGLGALKAQPAPSR